MASDQETPKKWAFKFRLTEFGFSGEQFPVDAYKVSDKIILLKQKQKPENCIACIIEEMDEEKVSNEYIHKQKTC